jgi:hypothetical protein
MEKQEIISQLNKSHQEMIDYIDGLDKDDFLFHLVDKWSAGQHLDHILRSIKPVSTALFMPQFILKYKFGKANRPSKSFEELKAKYHFKLSEGGVAFGRFLPEKVDFESKLDLFKKVNKTLKKFISRLNSYSEKELDTVILPHPLLGKLTMREMMYFTIFHAAHHHDNAVRTLSLL